MGPPETAPRHQLSRRDHSYMTSVHEMSEFFNGMYQGQLNCHSPLARILLLLVLLLLTFAWSSCQQHSHNLGTAVLSALRGFLPPRTSYKYAPPKVAPLIEGLLPRTDNDSCDGNGGGPVLSEEEADLRNVFVAHVLIIVVLVVTLVANAKEGKDLTCSPPLINPLDIDTLSPSNYA